MGLSGAWWSFGYSGAGQEAWLGLVSLLGLVMSDSPVLEAEARYGWNCALIGSLMFQGGGQVIRPRSKGSVTGQWQRGRPSGQSWPTDGHEKRCVRE